MRLTVGKTKVNKSDRHSCLFILLFGICIHLLRLDASFFSSFEKIYRTLKKFYFEWNQWKPILVSRPWSFVLRHFLGLKAGSRCERTGGGDEGWKRENWMENIEKVEPLWIENSNGKTRNFEAIFTYWDFRYKIMRNLNANIVFVVKCFKKAPNTLMGSIIYIFKIWGRMTK